MEYIRTMPWHLELDGELDCALFSVKPGEYKCEFETEHKDGAHLSAEERAQLPNECSPLPFSLGTSDTREPNFCFRHYFEGCTGDGVSDYKIVFNKE